MLMEARLLDERREGIAEGEAKHQLKVAKLMLAKGCYSPEDIAELTSLPIEQVEALKADQT